MLAGRLAGLVSAARKKRLVKQNGHPAAGTKMEEKENFRVQFLHTHITINI